jgi:arginine utilization protein RocB
MRVDKAVEEALPVLKANFPLWRDPNTDEDEVVREETFGVPFDLIRELNCDVANIGPWGKEAHGRGERVHMPYSFETVPQLIHNVILRLLGTEDERIPLPRSPNAEERR